MNEDINHLVAARVASALALPGVELTTLPWSAALPYSRDPGCRWRVYAPWRSVAHQSCLEAGVCGAQSL